VPISKKTLSMVGKTFNKLTIVRLDGADSNRNTMCIASCECGQTTRTRVRSVTSGNTKSCGCLPTHPTTHGLRHHPLYGLWDSVKGRVRGRNERNRRNYTDRGITIYPRWEDDAEAFIAYILKVLGPKPTPHEKEGAYSLDRIDNDGNYEPGNLRWATAKTQANNRRRRE